MGSFHGTLVTEHQNLRLYLESRMMFPPFLVEKYPKLRMRYEFLSSIQLVAQLLWTLRYVYFLTNTEDDPLNYYLADSFFMLGPARFPVNVLSISTNTTSFIALIFSKFSSYIQPGEHLHWLRDCEVFETGYFKGIGKFDSELKLLYWLKYPFITVVLIVVIAADILFLAYAPVEYYIFGILAIFYHTFDGGIILSYLVNRLAIFVFHMYLYTRYFDHLIKSIIHQPKMIENYLTAHMDLIGLYGYYRKSLFYFFIILAGFQILLSIMPSFQN